jgi:hypothetical protein
LKLDHGIQTGFGDLVGAGLGDDFTLPPPDEVDAGLPACAAPANDNAVIRAIPMRAAAAVGRRRM